MKAGLRRWPLKHGGDMRRLSRGRADEGTDEHGFEGGTSHVSIDVSYPLVPRILGLSPHGIFAAVGIGVGLWLLIRNLRQAGLPTDPAYRAVTWGVVAAIIGARVDYVVSHPTQFRSAASLVALWGGGLALFGGLIAGIAVATAVLMKGRVSPVGYLDIAAPSFPLAIAIGRVGDLMMGDHLGKPLGGGPGVGYRIAAGAPLAPGFAPTPAALPGVGQTCEDPALFFATCSYHLTAGYDLVGTALIALVLIIVETRLPGLRISLFGLLYGTQRVLLDFTRGIDERPLFGLTGTQLISLVVIGVSGAAVVAAVWRGRRSRYASPTVVS